jgi:thiamine biosynthesis lipoprotein
LDVFLKQHFEEYEQRYSRFRKDSELSRLNRKRKMKVSVGFWNLFTLARGFYEQSAGSFNPLLSAARLGYVTSYLEPSLNEVFPKADNVYNVDFSSVVAKDGMIELLPGQTLDFGGIAKGWTVDRAVEALLAQVHTNFLINAGGDLFACGEAKDGAWRVGLEGTDQLLTLQSPQALATSTSSKRKWELNGEKFHHIVSSETLDSSRNQLKSLTVLGSSLAECDAFATAAFSLGKVCGEKILKENDLDYYFNN